MKKLLLFPLSLLGLVPKIVSAHCPLCTAGAGALAILAASLGVSSIVVGVLIGAFSLALGLWISKLVKKKYIPYQEEILSSLIFLSTVLPLMPLVQDYGPFFVPFIGEYGSTYTINLYIFGVVIGTLIMFISPYISKLITKTRDKQIPFQGITITITLLILTSIIIQILS
ncbi:MAG: hypothetical protein WDZ80_02750 [Candidatus Paceibacterota bacterium]